MATRESAKAENTETKVSMVKIMLPAPVDEGEDDFVIVGVNGVLYQIEKGKEVEVPISVKEVLDNKEKLLAENRAKTKGRI